VSKNYETYFGVLVVLCSYVYVVRMRNTKRENGQVSGQWFIQSVKMRHINVNARGCNFRSSYRCRGETVGIFVILFSSLGIK